MSLNILNASWPNAEVLPYKQVLTLVEFNNCSTSGFNLLGVGNLMIDLIGDVIILLCSCSVNLNSSSPYLFLSLMPDLINGFYTDYAKVLSLIYLGVNKLIFRRD